MGFIILITIGAVVALLDSLITAIKRLKRKTPIVITEIPKDTEKTEHFNAEHEYLTLCVLREKLIDLLEMCDNVQDAEKRLKRQISIEKQLLSIDKQIAKITEKHPDLEI